MPVQEQTNQQYQSVIAKCREVFLKKAADYGPSWLIFRMPSVTDQIYIKAERIRSLQQTGINKVGDTEADEFSAIINYCVIAALLLKVQENPDTAAAWKDTDTLAQAYEDAIRDAFDTMQAKNHDYGEVWRKMRISSMTDLILVKIQRIKQIEDNEGRVSVSEGVGSNYVDILNYAVFCLIRMSETA